MKTNWKKLLNEGKIQRKGVSFKEVDRVVDMERREGKMDIKEIKID